MKRLNYLDNVKTPNDWKLKALDIPNQVENLNEKSYKRFKPSAILVACVLMLSISGVSVYAIESGAIDTLKQKFFGDTYTPYSYDGTYNDILETTALDNYIQTDVQVENLEISRDDIDFKVTGYIRDRNVNYITADIILPQGEHFTIPQGSAIFNFDKTSITNRNNQYGGFSYGLMAEKSTNNVVSVIISIDYSYTNIDFTNSIDLAITFGDLGRYTDASTFETEYEFDISFDIQLEDCGISKSIDNINKQIQLTNGSNDIVTLEKISYSPLMINFQFDELKGGYNNYIMYYIYKDGRRVFIKRDFYPLYNQPDENGICKQVGMTINYAFFNQPLVDFTDIVAIEINGEVIPIK